MPRARVVPYREDDGSVPLLDRVAAVPPRARAQCLVALDLVALERLRELGHELRRPEAEYLEDGIYELRVRLRHVNYRILYFFHGKAPVVVSHGLTKEQRVPPREVRRALERKRRFEQNPRAHTYEEV